MRCTITMPGTLGKMCRTRIRAWPAPRAWLASTNGRVRSDNTWPRTIRAKLKRLMMSPRRSALEQLLDEEPVLPFVKSRR